MPRNKSTKRASKKRQKVNNKKLVSIQKMEMDLMQTPSRMAAQLDKEIHANKKQEIKLNKVVIKITQQLKKAAARLQSAGNAKPVQKKFKTAKKAYDQAAKKQAALSKQLQAITHTLEDLTSKKSRYLALGKWFRQFNAEWAKTSKMTPSRVKSRRVASRPKQKGKSSKIEQLPIQPVENTMVNSTPDEVTDLAS